MELRVPDPTLTDGVATLRVPDERDLDAIGQAVADPDAVAGRRVDCVVFALLPLDPCLRG